MNDDLKTLAPGDRVRDAVNAARFNALTELAKQAASGSLIRGGPGVRVRTGPSGVTIRSTGGAGRKFMRKLPLMPRKTGAGHYACSAGLFDRHPVKKNTASGDDITDDDPFIMELTKGWIYLGIEYNVWIEEGFLTRQEFKAAYVAKKATSGVPDAANLPEEEIVPAGEGEPSVAKFVQPLARIVDDRMVTNYGGSNCAGLLGDNSNYNATSLVLAVMRTL